MWRPPTSGISGACARLSPTSQARLASRCSLVDNGAEANERWGTWADGRRLPLANGAQDGFHVENGSPIDRFEIADRDGVLLDAHDGDRVEPDRVRAIR